MTNQSMLVEACLIAAFISFAASRFIVVTQRWHGKLSLDGDLTGKQKFHKVPVPRVGGTALMLGVISAFACVHFQSDDSVTDTFSSEVVALIASSIPVFAIGLIEDLTKSVSVKTRFIATVCSALLASWSLGAILIRVDFWPVDQILGILPIAVIATAFAVVGVTNSINIIDGFNGIAGSTVIVILAGMGILGWQTGDAFITELSLLGIGATIGFLFVNYPQGKLFMGDGGAYFLGFWCAEIAVLTIYRNPGISSWQVLAIYSYPIIEVVYSIYRKKMLRKMSPCMPDRLHLHMLIYRRFICQLMPRSDSQPWIRNAAVSCVIAPWIVLFTAAAVAVGNIGASAAFIVVLQIVIYMIFYTRLVRGHWCLNPKVILGLSPEVRGNSA